MEQTHFDLIIIGGGATGSGIALDATLRGLKTLIVEKNDFGEGTSSRSTKLVHGGVRYLEGAVKKLDSSQYNLVKEALKERYRLLKNASHLASPITLVTPLYKWYEIPYMYIGLVLYDLISGNRRLGTSKIVGKKEIMDIFPAVKKKNLKGGVRYYDGAFNDAKMIISLLQSAKEKGCEVKNYTEVIDFLYEDTKLRGVRLFDKLKNIEYELTSDCIINATGVFSDQVRKLDDKNSKEMLKVSSGIHIVLDKKFLPNNEGIMIPKTEDGRVLFMLPYLGKCLVGTTDEESKVEEHPCVSNDDIEYLLRHIDKYFDVKVSKSDILSSWSGLRPLVINENVQSTKELVREHVISKAESGLISIVGGKWTTYRKMAEEILDFSFKDKRNLQDCGTKEYKLVGNNKNIINIQEKLNGLNYNNKLVKHLISSYGDCSLDVVKYIEKFGTKKLHEEYPYVEAEVYYSIDHEFTCKPLDFLVRRIGLGFIDKKGAKECLESTTEIFKDKFSWNEEEYTLHVKEAKNILDKNL
ncbi:glycerol-3-phosphate dehydrogenase/oxidase [Sulfurospirillum arcachonense]|uniref:glycerol-3-phosphate dehydrogenase/oxidase n=1 Tax=Sulfurospirillum arcachonense TaxID=57666 RepID=UPI00046A624C|nr:FAD-dependent oxidoreductase [Sulfurospirillum arcachonense]